MSKPDFTVRLVKDSSELQRLSKILSALPAFALDIETSDWWNRHRERIALIQIAFRTEGKIKVAVIDPLADLSVEHLRLPLEQSSALKIIHNAGFDAVRLNKHYDFNVSPVFDTMTAARRSGEKKYSLKAQAEIHLNLHLDKSARGSDWSRRPLDARQLRYAALDPYAALLLYENQRTRGLGGDYRLRLSVESAQNPLPLDNAPTRSEPTAIIPPTAAAEPFAKTALPDVTTAILGIVAELPNRYHPDGLAASIGAERVGLAGWIIDQRLGLEAEPDEETVKLAISDLCESGLVRITDTRRLEATGKGELLWKEVK